MKTVIVVTFSLIAIALGSLISYNPINVFQLRPVPFLFQSFIFFRNFYCCICNHFIFNSALIFFSYL